MKTEMSLKQIKSYLKEYNDSINDKEAEEYMTRSNYEKLCRIFNIDSKYIETAVNKTRKSLVFKVINV